MIKKRLDINETENRQAIKKVTKTQVFKKLKKIDKSQARMI